MKSNASYVNFKLKIRNRRRYAQKQKSDSSKDYLDLLGDPDVVEVFSGLHEDLENTAQDLYSSPPCPEDLRVETLSIKMLQNVPPTPGTALQHRIDKIEKNLGWQLNIQLQQQMGCSSLQLWNLGSLRDEIQIPKWGWIRSQA